MNKIFICLLFVLTVLASIACVSAVDVDNATSQTVVDVDDVGSNLVLDNNVDNNKYESSNDTKTFNVNKVDSTLNIADIVFDYNNSGSADVTFDGATGVNALVVNQSAAIVNVWDNKIEISGLNAGTYTLSVTTIPDANHNPVTKNATITVNKIDSVLIVDDVEFDYNSIGSTVVTFGGTTGVNARVVNQSQAVVNVKDNKIEISGLNAGTYTLSVTTVPDANHNSVTKTATIMVNKSDSVLYIADVEFDYNSIGSTGVTFGGATGVNASVVNQSQAVVNVKDNKIEISGLNAGTYTLTVTTVPDVNHNPVTKNVTITVNKVDSTLNITDIVFDYNYSGSADVTFDGATGVNASVVNQSEAVVNVKDNKIEISGLNAGTYTLTVTTVPDVNHNPVTKNVTITVNKVDSSFTVGKVVFEYNSTDSTNITFKGATGVNARVVNHPEAIVNIKDNKIEISGLNIGTYTLTVTTIPDANHNPVTKNAIITVIKKIPPNLNDIMKSKGSLALLQVMIDQASAGSTLYLDRDYTNNRANNIITINKNLVLDGQGHSVDFANFKYCFFASSKGDLIVRNLIIKNVFNYDNNGNAFYLSNKDGKYIFDNCSFIQCSARVYGGAIHVTSNKLLLVKNCVFAHNSIRDGAGGAIWAINGVVIESSVFKGNIASAMGYFPGGPHYDDYGVAGAVFSKKGNIYVSNSIFEENVAAHACGAICSKSGFVDVKNSTFRLNEAKENVGAIFAKGNIISTNCCYEMNLHKGGLNTYQLRSEKGHVKLINNFNPVGDFDNINDVSLNKQNVSFWVKNSKSLKDIFNFIESKKPAWENIFLTLSPNTKYYADYSNQFGFCLHLNTHLTIKGQPGSVITGNDFKNSFIYIGNTGALTLMNVTLGNFDHCFINRGALYCNNTFFTYHKVLGSSTSINNEGVIVNSGSAFFDHCIFSTHTSDPYLRGCSGYGTVLNANSHSLTIFSECNLKHCRDDFIWASDYSTVVVRQNTKIGEIFKDCYFAKTACFSVVSSKLYNGTGVFNCSSADQLQKVLYAVNSYTPNALGVVINLQPGVYELDADWLSKKNFMRSMDWRDEYYHHFSSFKKNFKNPDDEIERYALDVGIVPILINGHGSTVKLVKGNDKSENHFAFIGYGATLFVNNITFSNFNSVFHNYGSLNMINCTFSDNYDLDGRGAVVYGVESTANFIDCIFNKNKAGNKNTDIADLVGGILRFNSGCNFTNFFKTSNCIGSMGHGGLIEAPEELKSKFILKDSSAFKEYGVNESVHCFNITSNNYQSQLDYINNVTGLVILNLSDINGKRLGALPSASKVLVLGNGAHISKGDFGNANKGTSINIAMYWKYAFVNMTFSNYDKLMDNHGLCVFINCSFVNNACDDYLVSNNGSCSFINCKFINNKAKNLIFNDAGLISFDNCSFVNNSYSDKGLIYNKHGAIDMINCSILNSGKITIYNFETKDCNIWNTTGCTVKYAETEQKKESGWHKFWHYTILVVACIGAVVAAAVTAGYILPALVASLGVVGGTLLTIGIGAAIGLTIGAVAGGLDYAILGSIYGYPDAGSLMTQYIILGAICGGAGAAIMSIGFHITLAVNEGTNWWVYYYTMADDHISCFEYISWFI